MRGGFVFTDSEAAMLRIQSDAHGSGRPHRPFSQRYIRPGKLSERALGARAQGGVIGHEVADALAGPAAESSRGRRGSRQPQ